MPELDHALEWCENEIIAQHEGRGSEEASLRDWFVRILGTEEDAAELIHRCERLEVGAGEIIVSAGDAANSMHFILDGRVGVMIPDGRRRHSRGCEASAAIRPSAKWAWWRAPHATPPSRPRSPACFMS